jgi:hypothetical protein
MRDQPPPPGSKPAVKRSSTEATTTKSPAPQSAVNTPVEGAHGRAAPMPDASPHPWLLFVHQLPAKPSNLRVRTWRRLQQIGALAVKQAVYVLPDSPSAREDFEWLKSEIEAAGGQARIFTAGTVEGGRVMNWQTSSDGHGRRITQCWPAPSSAP